jgi:hypothetical protein
MVDAVARYRFLRALQLLRLLGYAPGSLTYVQTRLKRLSDDGYLERLFLPRPGRAGSSPLVYRLGARARALLAAQGRPLPERHRPSEEERLGLLFLEHSLAVNDFLISAELLARTTPGIQLARMLVEHELKRRPVRVQLANGRQVAVIPDGWLDFRLDGRYQCCLALELDRGTIERTAWQRRVEALVAFQRGPYQEAFGTPALTIVVATTAGAERCARLRRWSTAVLERDGRDALDLFRFAALKPAELAPATLFLEARWLLAQGEERRPLLEVTEPL